jgi:hypothetical protein
MRTLTLAIAVGLALAVSAQAAPLAPNRASVEAAAPPVELVAGGCGWAGIGTTGKTAGETGIGAGTFWTTAPPEPGGQGGTIPTHIGKGPTLRGVGAINKNGGVIFPSRDDYLERASR